MVDLRIVCLHGLGRGPGDWDAVLPALQAHGPVAAPDLRSGRLPAASPGTVLIGHSKGGLLALRIAAGSEQPPAGVILTGCPFPVARNGRTRRETAAGYAAHRIAFLRTLRERPPRAGAPPASPVGVAGVAGVLLRPGRFHALAAAVSAPVLVVHARDDHHVPVDFALAAAARHPGWEVGLLAAGGHHAHLRARTAWLAAVEPWLCRLRGEQPFAAGPLGERD
jgi:pimeloyl-ACP methyl ester carboxylesterase